MSVASRARADCWNFFTNGWIWRAEMHTLVREIRRSRRRAFFHPVLDATVGQFQFVWIAYRTWNFGKRLCGRRSVRLRCFNFLVHLARLQTVTFAARVQVINARHGSTPGLPTFTAGADCWRLRRGCCAAEQQFADNHWSFIKFAPSSLTARARCKSFLTNNLRALSSNHSQACRRQMRMFLQKCSINY